MTDDYPVLNGGSTTSQNISCFSRYQMNSVKCLSCVAGSHCYDEREKRKGKGFAP
ncbi:MAG: hypothetical protein WCX79_00440 [Candidatus Paceibacterota bacterium]